MNVADLTDGGPHELKVPTTLELVVDSQTSAGATPLCVDVTFKTERAMRISEVARDDEPGKTSPSRSSML